MSLLPSSGREGTRKTLPEETAEIQAIALCGGSNASFPTKELISISHDDVTNIQLCIYRDTPKSACLSAVPCHSQVPHPLCMCACMCNRKRCHPSYPSKTHTGKHTHLHSWDSGRIIPGLPNYYSPSCRCL